MKHEIDLAKYEVRTDLISEVITDNQNKQGYKRKVTKDGDITIENIVIDEVGEQVIHKKKGNYETIYFDDITDKTNYEHLLQVMIPLLKEFYKKENISDQATCLIIGLGNKMATPDALGPLVSDKVIVTRHLFSLGISVDKAYRNVATMAPGVMGSTGIETKDIILGLIESVKPDFLIMIDSLAASSIERINKTIQLTDTGIHPGSGIGNNRLELSKETLGVPVLAIGVPTVVDAVTIVSNTIDYILRHVSYEKSNLNKHSFKFISPNLKNASNHETNLTEQEKSEVLGMVGTLNPDEAKQLIAEVLMPLGYNLIVTPKEIDFVIKKLSDLIAESLNKSLHAI